ncbi:MAG: tRNA (cytidine/uridine-2'-O-)-methyltransferase [Candidatus Endobugula sp.]|jgi:tRNA (cytidine/uridine-2'-O-)-methyltransferase
MPLCNIVLFEPEIPPNTGNVIRLAANTGCQLHIIKPTGFELDDKKLRRAGLDYGEWQDMKVYENWDDFIAQTSPQRLFAISTKGKRYYHDIDFTENDYVVFGPETRGLPDSVLYHPQMTEQVRIPMTENSRSMNLSNSVAVIVYEAWRQQGFIHST